MRRLAILTLCFASALSAQARPAPPKPAPVTTVSGYVFDSLTDAPLKGATVIIGGTAASAVSDTGGRFVIDADSVPDGTYLLSFFHPALDSIGIAPPPRTVTIKDRASVAVDLAMPSAPSIIRAVCPDSLRRGGRGLLIGDVRDAESDRPLVGALVVVMWSEMTIGNSTISRLPQALSARSDSDGLFRICGVPAETPLRSQARLAPKASGWIDLSFPANGLVVQQFLIGELPKVAAAPAPAAGAAAGAAAVAAPAVQAGSATLIGSVLGGDGAPLEGAQVLLIGTTMTVSARSNQKGTFRLDGLPSGTHTVEVRLLSYQPKHYVVNLAPHRDAHLVARLDQRAQVLDPVTVTAKETTPVPGFDDRAAHMTGIFMNSKQIKDANTISVSDLFRRMPGMQVVYVNGQYVVVTTRNGNTTCQEAEWYVDGSHYMTQGEDMDALFKPNEIEAIEVYVSAIDTPVQFQGPQSQCGTVVIWTRRAHVKQKGQPAPPPD